LTYGLLVVVGVVWYQVFMRVKSNFEVEEGIPAHNETSMVKQRISKRDAFQLKADYRDPFTGTLASDAPELPAITDPLMNPIPAPPKPKPEPVYVQWPSIRYYGLVRKTTSANPRTLLSIDGYFYKVTQGENVLDDIYILKVTRDYVQIRYRKEVKTFNKIDN